MYTFEGEKTVAEDTGYSRDFGKTLTWSGGNSTSAKTALEAIGYTIDGDVATKLIQYLDHPEPVNINFIITFSGSDAVVTWELA